MSIKAAPQFREMPIPVDLPAEYEKMKAQLERYGFDIVLVNTPVPCVRVRLVNKLVRELAPIEIYIPFPVWLKTTGAVLTTLELPGMVESSGVSGA